jgi:hypothetical protein
MPYAQTADGASADRTRPRNEAAHLWCAESMRAVTE